jgi:hypothetical protein
LPLAHAAQVGGAVVLPGTVCSLPTAQAFAGVQVGAFVVVEKVPLSHVVHERSLVVVPSSLTNVPAEHVVLPTQAVTLFASWSQVPLAHGDAEVSPPGQY